MKKTMITFLALTLGSLFLLSCKSTGEVYELKDGFYVLENSEMGAYIAFDLKTKGFVTAAGMAISYAETGLYEKDGNTITLKTKNDSAVVLKMLSDSEIQIVSVKQNDTLGMNWLPEGSRMVFTRFGDPFETVASADEALAFAKENGFTVMENGLCTSGKEFWDTFCASVSKKIPDSAGTASYYTLDPERVSEELYEEEKDQYPQLFFTQIDYDGETFYVKTRLSTEETPESEESYKYLKHYTGKLPAGARHETYDYWVLTDDPDVTWEKIEWGMVSSQSGDWIRHKTVFTNYD